MSEKLITYDKLYEIALNNKQHFEARRDAINNYIFTFYNQKRRHYTLKYKTSNEYELNYKKIKNNSL